MAESNRAVSAGRKKRASDGNMTFLEHMSELRQCIVIVAATFLIATLGAYYFAPRFVRLCLALAEGYTFVQTGPAELMGQYIKVSVIVGLVVAVPVFVWQAHRFASPGLKKNEDRIFLGVMLSGMLFFALGAVFCWLIVVPFMLRFFLTLNTIDVLGMYSVKEYLTYLVSVIVAFGVVFEIPVLASLLALIGLLKPGFMVRSRKVVVILSFVIGAAITPTDVVSQFLVAVPMCVLYEVAILLVRFIYAARAKRHPEEVEKDEQEEKKMRSERATRWAKASEQADRERAKESAGERRGKGE